MQCDLGMFSKCILYLQHCSECKKFDTLHDQVYIIIYVFIHLHIEVHVLYMVYSKDNTNTILHSILTDK